MDFTFHRIADIIGGLDLSVRFENIAVDVDMACICEFPPGGVFANHRHSFFEFHYIADGYGSVELDGREYELSPGDVFAVPPGVTHRQSSQSEHPLRKYALQCDIRYDPNRIGADAYARAEYAAMYKALQSGAYVTRDAFGCGALFERMFAEAYEKKPGYVSCIKTLIVQVVIAFSRGAGNEAPAKTDAPRGSRNIHRIDVLTRYIRDNLQRSLSCRELAEHLFISPRHLERIVRAQTGYSVHDYVLYFRIQKIESLLAYSEDNLSKIAEKTGFSSEFHLSSAFKKWTGVSPALFRKSIAAGAPAGKHKTEGTYGK